MSKEQLIIEAAIQLFAKKGYHATSIQEIADRAGIAKGSIYSYFSSKEKLLVAIYRHYTELFSQHLASIASDDSLSPAERLVRQISSMFDVFEQQKDFIKMQIKEQAFSQLPEAKQIVMEYQVRAFEWYVNTVKEAFGPSIDRFVFDCAAILQGMIAEYSKYIFVDKVSLNHDKLSRFIVERLEDIVEGLQRRSGSAEPVLSPDFLDHYIAGNGREEAEPARQIRKEIAGLKDEILRVMQNHPQAEEAGAANKEYLSALNVLEEEFAADSPRIVVIKGMLSVLQSGAQPEMFRLCRLLERYMSGKV